MRFENAVSPKEAISRIKKSQSALNAAVTILEETEGKEGVLHNIPVVLKDNINTKGIKTTASSKILENYIPVYDATIVQKLREAGACFVAKASMDELGMGGTNKNAATGAVHNPYDLNRISGGSSGGSAVLVASDCVPLAIGTDTGDSVRKPAAYTGTVGVKPTYGRISRYGIIPYASSLDHVGYFTTNVKDAALALEVLAGRDDHDMTTSNLPVPAYSQKLNDDIHGKTIGIFKTVQDHIQDETMKQGRDDHDMTTSNLPVPAYSQKLNDDIHGKTIGIFKTVQDHIQDETMKQSFDTLVQQLKNRGANIVDVEMPVEYMNLIAPVYKTIANAEATANHSNLDGIRFGQRKDGSSVDEVMTHTRTEGFSSYVRARFVIGSYSLFEENQDRLLRKAQKIRRLLVEAYADCLKQCDGVLCLAAPTIAPLMDDCQDVSFSADDFTNEHMQLANFSGYPSMTLPLGKKEGCPFGVSLTCRPFEEQMMFDLASAIEEETGLANQVMEENA